MNPAELRIGRRVVVLAVLVCGVGAVLGLRRPFRRWKADVALKQAVLLTNESQAIGVPLSSESGRFASSAARLLPSAATLLDAAANIAGMDTGDAIRSAHAVGIANLIAGHPEEALRSLESISPNRRGTAIWTNLAVAEMMAGAAPNAREHLLTALVAADRAAALDVEVAAPWFVRARTFELLELRKAALAAWWQYLLRDSSSPWALIARAHAESLKKPVDDVTGWRKATARIETLSNEELARLTRTYPQQARTYAEGLYLPAWADDVEAGCLDGAAVTLARVRVIAEALQIQSGESLLLDVLRSISSGRIDVHAKGFLRYRRGRLATLNHDPGKALPDYEEAVHLFSSVSNPMRAASECYAAISLIDLNRTSEARQRLTALVAAERAAGSRHKALIAFALYHLALCDAMEGNWSDALAAAAESFSAFARLGERGLAGTVEELVSQAYDFLGQRHLAWTHGTQAVALLTGAGESRRARLTVGGLSRSELRHGRWESARVLIAAERVTGSGSVARDDCDMFLRLAAAEYHLGHTAEWQRALADARTAASKVNDASIRKKMLADVDAVAGSLRRRGDPGGALSYLSAAIEFQESADRALLLPELYLQRGRANRDHGRLDEAQRDFERGIQRLEQQRTHTTDADLRAGIFDDAGELFAEAVSLALTRHDVIGAFGYVERGRARAILEEIASKDGEVSSPRPIGIEALMASLPTDSLLVEYQLLDDAIVIFTVDRGRVELTRVPVRRDIVVHGIQLFIGALVERRDVGSIEAASQRLYEWLVMPLQTRLAGARSLIVVPDATLQQLPFAALMDPSTRRYLIENHVLLTEPSASIYAIGLRDSNGRRQPLRPSSAALFANPVLEGGPFENLTPLPASEREASRIARLYDRPALFARSAATASRFISIADTCDVVHFAGHSVIQPNEPWHSALVFATSKGDQGLLFVQRIARLSFRHTRVVVLASCSTLRGHTAGVEGVPSVARAFLVAGVPSVVGTLWDVDDSETGPLVATFHARLVKGEPPMEALRAAQLEALRSPVSAFRHPSHWAAFALLGSGK
jgi:CHAT domain-containing protein/tetratricopeptide (TPR) repeat protein